MKGFEALGRLKQYLLVYQNGFPYNGCNQSKLLIKEDLDNIENELKAFDRVSVLMKKYNIKDIDELEEIILNGAKL